MNDSKIFAFINGISWGYEAVIFHGFEYKVKKNKLNHKQQTSFHYNNLKHEKTSIISDAISMDLKYFDRIEEKVFFKTREPALIMPKAIQHTNGAPLHDCCNLFLLLLGDEMLNQQQIENMYA